MGFVIAMSGFVKWIGPDMPPGEVLFVRGVIGILAILYITWHRRKLATLSLRKWFSYAPRTIFQLLEMITWFAALTRTPFALASALGYSSSIFATLFSFFSGERVRRLEWGALAAGFTGVLIMAGPHLDLADASLIGVSLALAAATFAALSTVTVRWMNRFEDPVAISFYFSVTTTLGSALTVAGGWVMPSSRQWLALGLVGLAATGATLCNSAAFRYAEVSALAPLDYVELVLAVLVGFWIFNETPEMTFWVGVPLMVLPGMLIAWIEYRARRRSPAALRP